MPDTFADVQLAMDKPVPLDNATDFVRDAYARLALVTHRSQANVIGDDDQTLMIVCDWLLWQELVAEGRHAIHYEFGIFDWGDREIMASDIFLRANDWVYAGGDDPTFFRGVSMGRMFGAEMHMALLNYHRINRSLDKLIERFNPREVWFFDFLLDINRLDDDLRIALVRDVVEAKGVTFVDRSAELPREAPPITRRQIGNSEHGPTARLLLEVYSRALDVVTTLRCKLAPARLRTLIMINTNMTSSIVLDFKGGITPAFQGRTVPKTFAYIWHCIRYGIRLVRLAPGRLSTSDEARLNDIKKDLLARFASPAPSRAIAFAQRYFAERILNSGKFAAMARQIDVTERMIDRVKPDRIVVDTARSAPVIIYAEMARLRGIDVDYIWHSPLVPDNKSAEALGCDPRCEGSISRVLSWGRAADMWLKKIGSPVPSVRTGCPLQIMYTDFKTSKSVETIDPENCNVLLLQYTVQVEDLISLNATMYEHFVGTTKILKQLGYKNIRYKMHPGPGRQKLSYFERINARYDLGCDIHRETPFRDCLAWADLVIGPAVSGAFYEALTAKVPYLAFLMAPHSMDETYFDGYPLLTSMEQLPEALQRAIPDGTHLLDDLYDTVGTPNPSTAFWDKVRSDA